MTKRAPQMKWDKHSIKAELHRKGWTLTEIAAREGMHRTTLTKALETGTGRGAELISRYLSIPLEELWPNRRLRSPHVIYNSDKHGPSASQKKQLLADTPISEAEVAA
ncbi:helix-turn-helix domain-containing protein [Pseudovibrio sp. Tun.PSC04-5.I4]|uniref:helix-turn-helix domain-containing protein n=1 Tax=Pseudovibrio sp. Tun.PSC04-5.I4 TaxID=1798213 RepID=UPI0008852E07|nr:helix-turn-helix domain-containing protein [Pseudovibrio sp. Tun.PSC04-5.I4]SDQ18090.1 transcriptional regulator, Nlp family [Pseudovibrio sp. Tun.PSC04-5.I4]